jgi:hypothetical protein
LCEHAERGAIKIFGRPGQSTYDDRYPECYGDYATIPQEAFCGSPELLIGWAPFPIIQSGDNIHRARWFFPMAEKEDVIALRRKLSQTDVPASVFCKTSAKRVSRFVRDYFDAETAASRLDTTWTYGGCSRHGA